MGGQPVNHTLRIGLTGGIGSGKTTVSDMFNHLGVPVIDADVITRELSSKGQAAYRAMVQEFGPRVLDEQQELRRGYIRELVFSDQQLREKLESIIHPLVRDEITRQTEAVDYPYCIISIALLFETGRENSVDRILVVDAPEHLQLQRAGGRDGVETAEISKIMAAQTSRATRSDKADYIITNDKDLEYLRQQVRILHQTFLQLAGATSAG